MDLLAYLVATSRSWRSPQLPLGDSFPIVLTNDGALAVGRRGVGVDVDVGLGSGFEFAVGGEDESSWVGEDVVEVRRSTAK